ncbi:MAG: hypothetical protein FWF79_02920 [Defluviitaleaceae bacterium]|nr:hypothetical protein [Defluviitaleaceae bacterium]
MSYQILSRADLMAETMILGLRLIRGVSEQEFAEKFGTTPSEVYKNEIDALIKSGLLTHVQGRIALTTRGLDLANQVFEAFLNSH